MRKQFENLTAAELYCPRCRTARPVRERLLLVLPRSELFDYRCTVCGESLGSREVTTPPVASVHDLPTRPAAASARETPKGRHR